MSDFDTAPYFVIGERGQAYLELPEVRNPKRFLVNYAEGIARSEDGLVYELTEFLNIAARTDANGHHLVDMAYPPDMQLKYVRRYGDYPEHVADIEAYVVSLRTSTVPLDQAAVGMYDILLNSPAADNHVPPPADAPFVRIAEEAEDFFASLQDAGLGRYGWAEAQSIPEFRSPQVLGIFKHFMSRYIGDYPADYVLRTAGTEDSIRAAMDANLELVSVDEHFEAPHIIPNYKTSEVRHYRGHGVDVITFSDMMGAYAYAWGTDPELTLQATSKL